MKKIILLVLLIALILPIVRAEVQSLPSQKLGDCISVLQTCSNCTYVNLDSIAYPNTTKVYLDTPMNKSGYGYSLPFCDTSILGKYILTTCGDPDGVVTCVNYDVEVTSTGASSELMINIIFFIFLLLAIGLLIFAYAKGDVIFLFFAGIMFIVCGVYLFTNNLIFLPTILNTVLCWILWGLGAYFFIISGLKAMNSEVDL
jgi:hypothetical protein